jgi:hypothetical protein
MVPCRSSLNLALFGLGPSLKSHRSNLWLSSNKIALFQWTLDHHLKWLLRRLTQKGKATSVVQHGPLKSNIFIMFSYWLYKILKKKLSLYLIFPYLLLGRRSEEPSYWAWLACWEPSKYAPQTVLSE